MLFKPPTVRHKKQRYNESSFLPEPEAASYENEKQPEEKYEPDLTQWKESDIKKVINCEAEFFCEVLCRLSKELKCARNLDHLEGIISLASKFLLASAAKEKAIACQISASNGCCCPPDYAQDLNGFDSSSDKIDD